MSNVRAPPSLTLPAPFVQKFPGAPQRISCLRVGVISHPGSSQRYGERTNKSPTGVVIYNFGEKDCSGGREDDRKQGFCTQSVGGSSRETAPDG